MKKYYIAYGSNMNLTDMKKRCPECELIATATLSGYELNFRKNAHYIAANIEKKQTSCVPVVIFKISLNDEKNLDIYEDFPTIYKKDYIDVYINNQKITGMIYIMNGINPLNTPSDTYFKTIEDAYKEFNFNLNILTNALKKTKPNN